MGAVCVHHSKSEVLSWAALWVLMNDSLLAGFLWFNSIQFIYIAPINGIVFPFSSNDFHGAPRDILGSTLVCNPIVICSSPPLPLWPWSSWCLLFDSRLLLIVVELALILGGWRLNQPAGIFCRLSFYLQWIDFHDQNHHIPFQLHFYWPKNLTVRITKKLWCVYLPCFYFMFFCDTKQSHSRVKSVK